jgi:hypothetical protein
MATIFQKELKIQKIAIKNKKSQQIVGGKTH